MASALPRAELLVCILCRAGRTGPEAAERPGAALFRALRAARLSGLRVRPVECLSNCARGCSIALTAPGRWTYVYGDIDPAQHLAAVIEGARRYRDSPDGLVPWAERPDHFRRHCIARVPPLEALDVP